MGRWWGIALVLVGCAPPAFNVHASYAGAVDVERDRAAARAAEEMEWEGDHGVTVFKDALPEGLSVKDGKLEIAPEYAARYRLIGTIRSTKPDRAAVNVQALFLYPPFHSSVSTARDVYCKVQTPLRLLTLSLWSIFVPLNYACFIYNSDNTNDNMEIHVGEIRRTAAAMGAKIAIIGSVGDRKVESLNSAPMGRGGAVFWTSTSTLHAASVVAFALAVDDGAPVTPKQKREIARDKVIDALARAEEHVSECRAPDGPTGSGHVDITFSLAGEARDVVIAPPYAGTAVGECIVKIFRRATVPEFDGTPVTVGKDFTLISASGF